MKKTLKLFLCFILALSLILSFTACNNDSAPADDVEKEETEETVDGEKASEEVVKAFLDSYIELDIKDAMEYTNADLDIPFDDADDLIEYMLDAFAEEQPEFGEMLGDALKPTVEIVIDKMCDSLKYDITDVEEDDGEYTYTVEIEMIDMENTDAFGDFDTVGEEIVTELLANGEITLASTEEELIAAIIPAFAERLPAVVEEAMDNAPTKEETKEFVVIEEDGEWIIDADQGDVKEIVEELTEMAE